jgi:hypothetical protein
MIEKLENSEAVPMMTLAALAANAAEARPSGETKQRHAHRIRAGIEAQLKSLGTGWQVEWLGLSEDGANLAYIGYNAAEQALAVVIRGTIFTPIDLLEDLDVGNLVEFTVVPPNSLTEPLLVSQGAMQAFTEVMTIQAPFGAGQGTILEALTSLVSAQAPQTLYVTGHSLGGCIASMVALYLATGGIFTGTQPAIVAFTFAAPTAGLQAFANCYDKHVTSASPNAAWRYYNAYDAVPNAWASLANVDNFFPNPPGPAGNKSATGLINAIAQSSNGNPYVQTNQSHTKTSIELNRNYHHNNADAVCETVGDFLAQLIYQHANDTYLNALGAPGIVEQSPVVTGISPVSGPAAGGTPVIISGRNFRRNSEVDFGTVAVPATWVSEGELQVTEAPAGLGVVDIRVTTIFGTSPAATADQFAWLPEGTPLRPTIAGVGPFAEPTPYVQSGVLPNAGPIGGRNSVTITGAGFVTGCYVKFGDARGTHMVLVSRNEIIVEVPPATELGTVEVKVFDPTTDQHSRPSPQSMYSYGAPLVDELEPCCAPYNVDQDKMPLITVRGSGFTGDVSVTFDGNAGIVQHGGSDTEFKVQPPAKKGQTAQKTVPVIVTVNSVASALSKASLFIYTTGF